MSLIFLRIETRVGNLVAVFDRGYQMFNYEDSDFGFYDDGTFCLDEPNLRMHIRNIEAGLANPDRDASVERLALTTLLTTSREG